MAAVAIPVPRQLLPYGSHRALDHFGEIAGALERAAAGIARLSALLAGNPLTPVWAWRSRLEAMRLQAAIDGLSIDPLHLAAIIGGVRFRMDRGQAIIGRGAIFEAARHALLLCRTARRGPSAGNPARRGGASGGRIGIAPRRRGPHAWFNQHGWTTEGGERPALRACVAQYWQRCGFMPVAAPLLCGTRALGLATPKPLEA